MKYGVIFLLLLIKYILSKTPNYTLIKRRERITFNLDEKNSSFYAYLNYEEDFEEADYNEYSFYYFLKINKKIGMKCKIVDYFLDESEFNITSKEERDYPLPNLDVEEQNIQLAGYEKFKKGMENKYIIFLFYIKEEYYNVFDKTENFTIERINNTFYLNKTTLEVNLKAGELQLIKGITEKSDFSSRRQIFFISSPFSKLYINYTIVHEKLGKNNLTYLGSNLFLYNFYYLETISIITPKNIPEFYFIIFNPDNFTRNINIDYKSLFKYGDIQSNNLIMKTEDSWFSWEHLVLAFVCSDENGLFNIGSRANYIKRYFSGNIEDIKNLTDLKNRKYYKHYIGDGVFYTNKKQFFLLVNTESEDTFMYVEKINIEEKGKEVNVFNFTYFKISEGNTLNFTSKYHNIYIIKLVSDNNGTVMINNNNYYFEAQKLEIIELKENETFTITAIDNNFTFAIKLKIPDDYIEYGEIGKKYIMKKDKKYKVVIYELNAYEYSSVRYYISPTNIYWSYEMGFINLLEIEKKVHPENGIIDLDLSPYNITQENKACYLIFFFENITFFNITVETEYSKSLPIEEDTFFQVNGSFIRFSYENENISYSIIPYDECYIERFQRNHFTREMFNYPSLIIYQNNDYGTRIKINTENQLVFISYHKYKEGEKIYSYNKDCREYFWLDDMNEKYLRFNFSNLFSDAPEINYTLVISPIYYYEYLKPDYAFFDNFYLNNINTIEELLVYHFSSKDMTIVNKDVSVCATNNSIDLPSPDISYFRKEQTRYMFKLMGFTGPNIKFIKFYKTFYFDILFCFNTCLACDYRGDEQRQNCISCYNDSLLQEDFGNCVNSCSIGYYKEDKFCKKCSDNCETCSNITENENNYCLSCNRKSKFKYLLNASNYGSNCVESCPKDTVLDEINYICIDNQNNDQNGNNNKNLKYYIIIPVISIILVAIIIICLVIISKKNKLKKEKDTKIIDDINDELVQMKFVS